MKLNMLLGTLIGFTVVFVVSGFWTNEFTWSWWAAMLIGGTIGHLIFAYFVQKSSK